LVLAAAGTLDASVAADLDIKTWAGGMPGPRGATFLTRETGSTDWLSHDPPTALSRWDYIERSTVANKWARPHGVRLASGLAAAVAVQDGSDVVAWREGLLSTWAKTTIHAGGVAVQACLVPLENGQLAALYTVAAGAADTQLRMEYSTDGGATWTLGATAALDYPVGYTPVQIKRIRAAAAGGQILLMMWIQDGATDILYQFAGDSVAGRFVTVETASLADKACPDVVAHAGGFAVVTIEYDAALTFSDYVPRLRKLTTAYQSFSGTAAVVACYSADITEWGAYAAGAFTSTECALLLDDDGALYVYGRDHDAAGTGAVTASVSWDGGATWSRTYVSPGNTSGLAVYDSGDATVYMRDLAVIPERGRALLLHTWEAAAGPADDSLCVAYLGGFTSVPMPDDIASPTGENVAGFGRAFCFVDYPELLGATWARVSTGAPTRSLTSDGVATVCAALEDDTYTAVPVMADTTGGVLVVVHGKVVSGTGEITCRISDGVNDYTIRVSVTTTAITLRDTNAGANIATATPTTSPFTSGYQVFIALRQPGANYAGNDGQVSAWYRAASLTGEDGLRTWTLIATSATLTSGAAVASFIKLGNAAGVASYTWRSCWYVDGAYTAGNCSTGAGTRGRTYSTSILPGHVWRGLRLWAVDGPGRRGDLYATATVYDYGAMNLDAWACPSPRKGWRSTDVSQNHDITRTVDLGWVAGELAALVLAGANARIYQWRQDSGGGTVVADIDLAIGTGLKWSRSRDCVIPVAGGTAFSGPLAEDALAGCWWVSAVGAVPRKIKGNSSGHWLASAVTGSRPVRIYLEEYGGAAPATGSTGMIWTDRAVVVTDLLTSTDQLTLRIPFLTNAGVADYFSLSTLIFGRFVVFGHPHGPPSYEDTSGVEATEGRYGSHHAVRLMAGRQAVDMPWADGMDVSRMHGTSPPDYMTLGYTSAPPIAIVQADMSGVMRSVVRDVGATVPVLYVPALPQQTSAPTTAAPIIIGDPTRQLLGWIETDTLRTDVVLGAPFRHPNGQLVRGGTVRLREVK